MITVRQVSYTDWLAEKELIAEYAAECHIPDIGPIDPHEATYAALEAAGMMRSFGVFEDDRMVGFATVLTPILPHYSRRVANLESLFVAYGIPGAGQQLMRAAERYAQECGCEGILYSAPSGGRLESLLDKIRAYRRTNAVFFRSFR